MFGSTTADNHNPMKVCALTPWGTSALWVLLLRGFFCSVGSSAVFCWVVSQQHLLTHPIEVMGS